jgi:hypothetical protein
METILKFVIRLNFEICIAVHVSHAVTAVEVGSERSRGLPRLQPNMYTSTFSRSGGRGVT